MYILPLNSGVCVYNVFGAFFGSSVNSKAAVQYDMDHNPIYYVEANQIGCANLILYNQQATVFTLINYCLL